MFVAGAPGAERAFVPAGAIFAAWAFYARGARAGLAMLAATMATLIINRLFKRLLPRRRPDGALSRTASFPSGHAMAGVAVYGTALEIAGRFSWHSQPLIAAAALLFGLLIGLTRIARRQHWPSDVAAGLALGLVIFAAAAALQAGRREKSVSAIRPGWFSTIGGETEAGGEPSRPAGGIIRNAFQPVIGSNASSTSNGASGIVSLRRRALAR